MKSALFGAWLVSLVATLGIAVHDLRPLQELQEAPGLLEGQDTRPAADAAPGPVQVKPAPPPGPLLVDFDVANVRTFTDPRPIIVRPTTRTAVLRPPVATRPALPDLTTREAFTLWATQATRVLSERFEVPAPAWVLEPKVPDVVSLNCRSVGIYEPGARRIRVFELLPDGRAIPLEDLRHWFLHGFLHHLETVRGAPPAPPGHEAEFDRWLEILGLSRRRPG